MNETQLKDLLQRVQSGACPVEEAVAQLRRLPFSELPYATLDHHRSLRTGLPEVVLATGKHVDHLLGIIADLRAASQPVLITRLSPEQASAVKTLPGLEYNALARTAVLRPTATQPPLEGARSGGKVAIVTAGTSDLSVAEEAAVTAELFGNDVVRINDVGVAGLHRLLAKVDVVRSGEVIIVVAGMEGALASVVAGLVDRPVIAVPTSVGYGASFSGLAALLGMLSSCASGVTVVNIDNGFGAAHAATLMLRGRARGEVGRP